MLNRAAAINKAEQRVKTATTELSEAIRSERKILDELVDAIKFRKKLQARVKKLNVDLSEIKSMKEA